MDILILGPDQNKKWNWGHQHFRNAIARHEKVNAVFYGSGFEFGFGWDVVNILEEYGWEGNWFDVIILEGPKYAGPFQRLDEVKDILKVCLCVDYTGDRVGIYNDWMNRCKADIAVFHNHFLVDDFNANKEKGLCNSNIKPLAIPYAVDIDIYKNRHLDRLFDCCAIFSTTSWAYPLRGRIKEVLRSMPEIKSLVAGDPKKRLLHQHYVDALNMSKIAINSNCNWGQLNFKYTEAMACGCLLLTDKPKDYSKSGFVDGEHLVLFDGLKDMLDKLRYYLQHPNELAEIAKNGENFATLNYSTKAMADLFISEVEAINEKL